MEVIVESKNFRVTAGLRSFVSRQARKIARLSSHITAVRVFLESVEKKRNDPTAQKVTYQVEIPGKDVVVKKHGVEMYETIVSATAAAARNLRKQFERRRTKSRN